MAKILIIEDDAKTANAVRTDLRGEGYEAAMARTGEDGVLQLHSSNFDLVLLDWMLPGRDGLAIVKELRARGAKAPVLHKTRSRAEGGAGLGLAIAKLAVERRGGPIELESIKGQGSTFRASIPAGA